MRVIVFTVGQNASSEAEDTKCEHMNDDGVDWSDIDTTWCYDDWTDHVIHDDESMDDHDPQKHDDNTKKKTHLYDDMWSIIFGYMDVHTQSEWSLTCKRHHDYFLHHVQPTHWHLACAIAQNHVCAVRFLLMDAPHAKEWALDPSVGDGIMIRQIRKDEYMPMIQLLFDAELMRVRGFSYTFPLRGVSGILEHWATGQKRHGRVDQLVDWLFRRQLIPMEYFRNDLLHVTCIHDNFQVVQFLLQNTSLEPCYDHLVTCIRNNALDVLCVILQDGRVDPNMNKNDILDDASWYDNLDAIKLLLKDQRVRTMLTPQQYATWHKLCT